MRNRRRAAAKAARRGGAPAFAAAATNDDERDAEPPAHVAAAEQSAVADAVDAGAPAAADAPLEAGGAQTLGDIFPWLNAPPQIDAVPLPPLLTPLPTMPLVPALPAAPPPLPPLPPLPAMSLLPAPPAAPQAAPPLDAHAAMAAELARIRAELDASRCAICLEAPKSTLLLPCRHQPVCGAAACFAMLGAPPLCPLCREPVLDTVQAFV